MFLTDWLVTNWPEIAGAVTAGFAFAVALAKLTPSKADDEFLASLYAKFGALTAFLPLPRISETAKAVVAADKAAVALDKAAEVAAEKAAAVDAAKAKTASK